ncbi:two pore domain potassium channel family protein [Vibrio sp. SM6]|uniref:Two pore domain potassium channel family protein n=1 Tax=Vibrio agarilyticus TaxID=2726741 RepID=A0A7X8TM29_9VIBR|nr:potassium channel family protein [Vibrio agarilyticus]NLS11270.1 two pore domain potassium channel family protein [Vibrio agarilyticus]
MALWGYIKRWVKAHLFQLTGRALFVAVLAYFMLSWLLLRWAGETALTDNFSTFVYFLMVTASTVGYGDMSPTSAAGRWVAVLFVIPGGLSLFAALLGQIASAAMDYWRAGILGKRRVNVDNHIILLGWNEGRTLHLIRMLQHEEAGKRPIVLCTRAEIENPFPGEIGFVRVTSYTDSESMAQAGIERASCIIVDNLSDDITLSAALYCAFVNSSAHLLAYFQDEALGQLLKQHCPKAECIPAVGAEMLAKAAVDPGSSALHQELLASTKGMTQYSVVYPDQTPNTTIAKLFHLFKAHHHATLIAVKRGEHIELNPELDIEVSAGMKLFYIADERVEPIDWQKLETID